MVSAIFLLPVGMQAAVGPLATYIFQGDSGQTVIFGHIEYSGGRLCIETNVRILKD